MNRTGRLFARVVLSAIGALATHGASAQTADDAVVCNGPHSTVAADDRIAACTRVIDSGQWRVEALGWAYLNRCLAQYDKRDWDEALSDCSKAIEIDPKVAQAFIKRGFVWQAKGKNDKAIADYDEAIRLDPKDAVAFVNRGIAWGAMGDNDRAIDDYDQRCSSIQKTPERSSIEATFGRLRASTTRQSPTTTRRSGSTRNSCEPS